MVCPPQGQVVRVVLLGFAYGALAVSSFNYTGFGSIGLYLANASSSDWFQLTQPKLSSILTEYFAPSLVGTVLGFYSDRGALITLLPEIANVSIVGSPSQVSTEKVTIVGLDPQGAPQTWSSCTLSQIGKGIYAGICRAPVAKASVRNGYSPTASVTPLQPIVVAPQGFAAPQLRIAASTAIIDQTKSALEGAMIGLELPAKLAINGSITWNNNEYTLQAPTATITNTTYTIPLNTNYKAAYTRTLNSTPTWTLTNVTATQPPPPPQPAPSQNPPQPPIQPQVVIVENPMPNTTNPIPVTITVKIRYPGLKQIINQFKVYYEIHNADSLGWNIVDRGYLKLKLIPNSDEATASLSVPGDRRYDVVINIIFNGGEIESAIVRNYQLKLGG